MSIPTLLLFLDRGTTRVVSLSRLWYSFIMEYLELLLLILFIALAINIVVFALKNPRVPLLKDREEFSVRYRKTFLYVSLIFFAGASIVVLRYVVYLNYSLVQIIFACVLLLFGLPFLIMALSFKIIVTKEGLVYKRRLIKYEDIKGVRAKKYYILLHTPKKVYKFLNNLDYKEELFSCLANKGAEIIREDI